MNLFLRSLPTLLFSACSFGSPSPGPKQISVLTQPSPYQSRVASDGKFVLDFRAETLSTEEIDAFSNMHFAEIVDTSGVVVPSTSHFAINGNNDVVGFRVELLPQRPLSTGWHDLVLTSELSSRSFRDTVGFLRRQDGRLFTRYHVGGNPTLLTVMTCDYRKLTVEFSEAPAQSTGLVALQVIEGGATRDCVVNTSTLVPSTRAYSFDCGQLGAEFQLDVSGQSELGVDIRPFGDGAEFPVSISLQRVSTENPDCLYWSGWRPR